MQEYVRVHIRP